MKSKKLASYENDYYALVNLLSYNYVRSPFQYQFFGGSAQSMHDSFSNILLKLVLKSDEKVIAPGVDTNYSYKDFRKFIEKLKKIAIDNYD